MEKLILDSYARKTSEVFWPEDRRRLGELVEVVWGRDDALPEAEAQRMKSEATYIAGCRWVYGGLSEAEAPGLKAVFELGGGHWSPAVFDYETAFRRGIRVLSCAPAFAPWVAEMALGAMIGAARDLVESDRAIREGREIFGKMDVGTLFGARVGIVGFGNLALALQDLLRPFRCTLSAFDPWLPASRLEDAGVRPASLPELMRESDFIVILAIPTASNRAMITRELLLSVRTGAVVVLMSRAHVVDFDALVELADQGRFTAAIDVYPEEPPPPDSPVRRSRNTVLTAHLAGGNQHARRNIGHLLVRDLEAMVKGLPPGKMQLAQPEIIALRSRSGSE